MKRNTLAMCLLLCLGGTAMASEAVPGAIYKWVDGKGVVHYADRPALNSDGARSEQAINKANLSSGDNLAAQKNLAVNLRDNAQRRREDVDKGAAAKEAAAQEASRLLACNTAREAQRTLAAGGRMAVVDAKGEKLYLDEAAIAERAATAAKAVDQACSPPKPTPAAAAPAVVAK